MRLFLLRKGRTSVVKEPSLQHRMRRGKSLEPQFLGPLSFLGPQKIKRRQILKVRTEKSLFLDYQTEGREGFLQKGRWLNGQRRNNHKSQVWTSRGQSQQDAEDSVGKACSQLVNPQCQQNLVKHMKSQRSPAISIRTSTKMNRYNTYVCRRGDTGGYQGAWGRCSEILACVSYINLHKEKWFPMTSGLHQTIRF